MSASNRGTIRRRISLLAGSSLAAATIALGAGGTLLAPTVAMAANECAPVGVDPSANGAAADTYACAGANTYNVSGITYSSAGALTVNSTGAMSVGAVGVNLAGNAADAVTFTATGVISGTAGPVIDVSSVSGAISVTTAGVSGTDPNVTYGVNAISTGGGTINIANSGVIDVGNITVGAQPAAAIHAVSTGGAGAVSVSTTGNVTGRQYGIQARSSGAGPLTITVGTVSTVAVGSTGVAAIDATTGTGLLTIELTQGNSSLPPSIDGWGSAAIRTSAGGDAVININLYRPVIATTTTTGIIDVTAVGKTTINNRGSIGIINNAGQGNAAILAIHASGGAFTLNNDNVLFGRIDASALTGALVINNSTSGIWNTSGTSNFGGGTGEINNDGRLNIASSLVTFTGLEDFNNSASVDFTGAGVRVLSMPGATFTGLTGSRLQMEATLGTAGQASCAAATVADCLGLVGGETAGVTSILVTPSGPVTTDANTAGIVLVDVNGGTSHAGDFILDENTPNYARDPVYGAVIATPGWLGFALQYNAATQQHILSTVVPTQKLEYIAAPQEVLSIWQSTSDTVAGRNADLRDHGDAGAWVRVTGEHTKRDMDVAYTAGGAGYAYADSYEIDATTLVAGYDLLRGEMGGGDFVLGLHGGAVKASMERTSSPTTDEISGAAAGLYTGWWSDQLTLDATLNLNFLTLDHDRPVPEIGSTSIISAGVRAEAGWRVPMGPSFYVQPLVTAAYAHADIKEVVESHFTASYEDVDSLRAAVGARVGGTTPVAGAALSYWVTGRAWNEFSGDGSLIVATPAEDVAIQDDLGGAFQELGAGLSLSNERETLEGYVSGGARFGDDIDNYNLSFGLRLRW